MISPQSIAVAAASSQLIGQEGRLFRMTLPHSLGLLAIVCLITYLQAYALPGMVPPDARAHVGTAKPSLVPLGPGGVTILAASALILAALAYVNARAARTPAVAE